MKGRFFERVWDVVSLIPPGRVASYGQIASLLEHPRAARTVGWALASLPNGSDVPWQRVVNSQGYISTAFRGESTNMQRQLLEAEGVTFNEDGRIDMRTFGWNEETLPSPARDDAP
jgi:methylated-DNA-protein-cysteine methyltransferase-like protein